MTVYRRTWAARRAPAPVLLGNLEVLAIDLLRRMLGIRSAANMPEDDAERAALDEVATETIAEVPTEPPASEQRAVVNCPSCGTILDPPPARRRLCPSCRQPIIVRQVDGRPAYLTEEAVAVFEAERQREAHERVLMAASRHWLELAEGVGVPEARRTRLARAAPSDAAVAASRRAYVAGADQAVVVARREQRWADVSRIRRAEAAALYAADGSPVPPPEEVVALHREGVAAILRELSRHGTEAELVGAGCCKACRAGDGRAFRIANELREPRLPHPGCPKGLCGCDWWVAVTERKRRRR